MKSSSLWEDHSRGLYKKDPWHYLGKQASASGSACVWRGGQPTTASLTVFLDESEEVVKSIQSLPS